MVFNLWLKKESRRRGQNWPEQRNARRPPVERSARWQAVQLRHWRWRAENKFNLYKNATRSISSHSVIVAQSRFIPARWGARAWSTCLTWEKKNNKKRCTQLNTVNLSLYTQRRLSTAHVGAYLREYIGNRRLMGWQWRARKFEHVAQS